jgi:hypothetical protein
MVLLSATTGREQMQQHAAYYSIPVGVRAAPVARTRMIV